MKRTDSRSKRKDRKTYVNVITHTGAIESWVIIPEDGQLLSTTHRNLQIDGVINVKVDMRKRYHTFPRIREKNAERRCISMVVPD